MLSRKKKVMDHVVREFQRVYKAKSEDIECEKELNTELNKVSGTWCWVKLSSSTERKTLMKPRKTDRK